MDTENNYISVDTNNDLEQVGVKRRSGRYPWGSGEDPYQHEAWTFREQDDKYRHQGLKDTEIAAKMGISTTELRQKRSITKEIIDDMYRKQVLTMHQDKKSVNDICERTGLGATTVRKIIKGDKAELTLQEKNKNKQIRNIADSLKEEVEKKEYVGVGLGSETQFGISQTKFNSCLKLLKDEGYYVHTIHNQQLSNRFHNTKIKVLTKNPDPVDTWRHRYDIHELGVTTNDGGLTMQGIKPPMSIPSDKIEIVYSNQGGTMKDGFCEIARDAPNLDMGNSRYCQARVAVDGKYYIKGTFAYSDNVKPGKWIRVYSNKPEGTPIDKVLKPMKDNEENPFGSTITRQSGALNIVNEQGDWAKWSHGMASQMLSKQPERLVKERLNATYKAIEEELTSIKAVTHPTVRQKLLEDFSKNCAAKASELKADGLPGSQAAVIFPANSLKPTEIYAPNYRNGDTVVLVRYPHGGTFELAELTVNNNNKEAASILGKDTIDAVGIHSSVAQKLSGADFDGDTVYIFPQQRRTASGRYVLANKEGGKIKVTPYLKDLRDFDPAQYHVDHDTISKKQKGIEMGITTNLITDMTIKGAPESDIVKAVKHSMVVIDAEKHQYDWRRSAIDNDISALQKKYQDNGIGKNGRPRHGASTIISKASSEIHVPKTYDYGTRKGQPIISKKGESVNEVKTKMDIVDDAMELVSKERKPVEILYAQFANKLKRLESETAKDAAAITSPKWDRQAEKRYSTEVKSLNEKYKIAIANKPKERQAQLIASKRYSMLKDTATTKEEKSRLRAQLENAARKEVGARSKDTKIHFTEKEWEAVQAGAISNSRLKTLLEEADMNEVRELATPRTYQTVSTARQQTIKSLSKNGYTQAEIAQRLGISSSTVSRVITGEY